MESNEDVSNKEALTAIDDKQVFDWLNLPSTANSISLWRSLHDAQIVSIQSDLLRRTVVVSCEIDHLRDFHKLDQGFTFQLHLEGVQSARVLRYAIWPGGFTPPAEVTPEKKNELFEQYQAKWRQETLTWTDFEVSITRKNGQVFDISGASLAISGNGVSALNLTGHLNHASYHEIYFRSEALRISGNDGRQFRFEEFQGMGEAYWDTFSKRSKR